MDTEFEEVDFRDAVFRAGAIFVRCVFRNCRFENVVFGGTRFEECVFAGDVIDVGFHSNTPEEAAVIPANDMKGCDFSGANLRHFVFAGMDMADTVWPEGDDAVLVTDYRRSLERGAEYYESRDDAKAKGTRLYLLDSLKQAGPNQSRGYFSRSDLVGMLGSPRAEELIRVLLTT